MRPAKNRKNLDERKAWDFNGFSTSHAEPLSRLPMISIIPAR
jgi:hypothetical protein